MQKVLMVCLGNICRSPVAEGVFRSLAEAQRKSVIVDSAGTASFHIGEHPDPRSIVNALSHDISIGQLRGRQFQLEDFENFDVIYVMDQSNLKNVLALAQSTAHRSKVFLLTEAAGLIEKEVPDPYYGTVSDFEKTFDIIHRACSKLVNKL
ncbi:MAG: hypothetical protein RIQ89_1448 [Bacteroidota bacterium]